MGGKGDRGRWSGEGWSIGLDDSKDRIGLHLEENDIMKQPMMEASAAFNLNLIYYLAHI